MTRRVSTPDASGLRVLTVRQPWAFHIIESGKNVENRSRNIAGKYRGPVAIHAGLGTDTIELRDLPGMLEAFIADDPPVFHHGAIVGVVDLVDAHPAIACAREPRNPNDYSTCSPWAYEGGWHLVFENPIALDPIPYVGALGLRTIQDDYTLTRVATALAGVRATTEGERS